MQPQRIIYVYRRSWAGEGSALCVASTPCPAALSGALPPGSPMLRRIAANRLREISEEAGDHASRQVVHSELAVSGDGTSVDVTQVRKELRQMGHVPVKNDTGELLYECRPGCIVEAISRVRESSRTAAPANTRKVPKAAVRRRAGHPAADALDWNEAMRLIKGLCEDEKYRDAMLVGCGCYLGLRISDLLRLTWSDLLTDSQMILEERKTGKHRSFRINPALRALASDCYDQMCPGEPLSRLVFQSWAREEGNPISRQRAGQILHEIKEDYSVRTARVFSTHSLRKTFGRRVWLQECKRGRGEQALLLLSDVFGHSSIQITKRYLGIRQEEILSVYDTLNTD